MASDDVLLPNPNPVRHRPKRPRSKSFKGTTALFSINIAGYVVPVFKHKKPLEDDAVGLWDPNFHEIAVTLPAPSPAAEADRLLHEVFHAISTVILPPELRLNELQVNGMSTALVDTLSRNVELRDFLITRLHSPKTGEL